MEQSTADAVQRFEASCRAAILQSNNISDDQAVEVSTLISDTGQYLNTPHENDGATLKKINCPKCTIENWPEEECCGHGHCEEETCVCKEGMLQTDVH